MNNSPIGIFDSGFGGLTVARAIHERLPRESIIYFGDHARCPYGPRTQEEVRSYVRQICNWFSDRDVKLVVIACNTATAAGLAMAQREFPFPIVGVVEPGARAAVRTTRNRRVGVIATQGTIDSEAYTKAMHALDAGIQVTPKPMGHFVDFVEECMRERGIDLSKASPEFMQLTDESFEEINKAGVDTLVLGCTHFPLLRELIRQKANKDITLIASSYETAKDVEEVLTYRHHLAAPNNEPEFQFVTTALDVEGFKQIGSRILGEPVDNLTYVDVKDL